MPPSILRPTPLSEAAAVAHWSRSLHDFHSYAQSLGLSHSLGTVARVSGWLWRPQLDQPLLL